MSRFASRDLMVATLPQDEEEGWELAGNSCEGCTNDTGGGCSCPTTEQKPKPMPGKPGQPGQPGKPGQPGQPGKPGKPGMHEFRMLQEQLRALRS